MHNLLYSLGRGIDVSVVYGVSHGTDEYLFTYNGEDIYLGLSSTWTEDAAHTPAVIEAVRAMIAALPLGFDVEEIGSQIREVICRVTEPEESPEESAAAWREALDWEQSELLEMRPIPEPEIKGLWR